MGLKYLGGVSTWVGLQCWVRLEYLGGVEVPGPILFRIGVTLVQKLTSLISAAAMELPTSSYDAPFNRFCTLGGKRSIEITSITSI